VTDEPVAPIDSADPSETPADAQIVPPRRRWVRRVVLVVVGLAALCSGYFLVNLWLVYRTGETDQARPVDAIVVLGAAQYDGRPSPQLAARLDHVVVLWKRGLAPMVITTGGKRLGDRFTEAEASAKYLETKGVPAAAIQQVSGATSYDELVAARDLLRSRDLRRVVLVSDPYHLLRTRLVSQELGLVAYVSPTPTSLVRGSRAFWLEVKEAAGVSVGRLIGFDRLLRITG
jgi:uncharacterized SAM-binding protein YcdF (DUF218 family)